MKSLDQIRMITTNFSALQGLKIVPLGLLLAVVSLWANAHRGPARDILFPGGCMVAAYFLYWLIGRYYEQTYGIVQPTFAQRKSEWARGLIGGLVGLVAFWADVSFDLKISLIGLFIAGAILAEYVRMDRQLKDRYLLFYPAAALLMILLSMLPVLGINWWEPVGIKALLIGVSTVTGFLFILMGLLAHISLVRWLPLAREANHGQRV
jgi:hypothetical protein